MLYIQFKSCQKGVESFRESESVLKKDLKMFPYKVQLYHHILPRDIQPRINYGNYNFWIICINNDEILVITFFSDEAWSHFDSYMNSQNIKCWSMKNPIKLGLWLTISRRRIRYTIFLFMKA